MAHTTRSAIAFAVGAFSSGGYCQVNKIGNRKAGISAVYWRQKWNPARAWKHLLIMLILQSMQLAQAILIN